MKLTASEIRKHTFKSRISGFNPAEVLNFLETIAGEWEESQRQQSELREKIIELETKLKDYLTMEKAIQQTFLQAQETSMKGLENARKEAQLIIQEAEIKAAQIVDKARTDLTTLKEQFTILKAKKDSIVARLKMMLHSELDLIKALEVDEELQLQQSSGNEQEITKAKTEIEEIIKQLE